MYISCVIGAYVVVIILTWNSNFLVTCPPSHFGFPFFSCSPLFPLGVKTLPPVVFRILSLKVNSFMCLNRIGNLLNRIGINVCGRRRNVFSRSAELPFSVEYFLAEIFLCPKHGGDSFHHRKVDFMWLIMEEV